MSRQVILDSEGNDITDEFFGETVIGIGEMERPEEDILNEKIDLLNKQVADNKQRAAQRKADLLKKQVT